MAKNLTWVTSQPISRPKAVPDEESLDWRGTKSPTLWLSVRIFLQPLQRLLNGPVYKVAIMAEMGTMCGCPSQGFSDYQHCWLPNLPTKVSPWYGTTLQGAAPRGKLITLHPFCHAGEKKFSSLEETCILSTYLLPCPRIFCQKRLWLQNMVYCRHHCCWSRESFQKKCSKGFMPMGLHHKLHPPEAAGLTERCNNLLQLWYRLRNYTLRGQSFFLKWYRLHFESQANI